MHIPRRPGQPPEAAKPCCLEKEAEHIPRWPRASRVCPSAEDCPPTVWRPCWPQAGDPAGRKRPAVLAATFCGCRQQAAVRAASAEEKSESEQEEEEEEEEAEDEEEEGDEEEGNRKGRGGSSRPGPCPRETAGSGPGVGKGREMGGRVALTWGARRRSPRWATPAGSCPATGRSRR